MFYDGCIYSTNCEEIPKNIVLFYLKKNVKLWIISL